MATARQAISRPSPTAVGAITGLVAGLIILGPALSPGYLLHYDLVHVPRLGLGARTLGLDGAVPRAVPHDALVALASLVLPGWVVQKVVLLGVFVIAGAGAGRLARTRLGAVAGAVLLTWNPWVGERLGIGHWGHLIGYALLPWVLAAAGRVRRPGSGRPELAVLALTVALAALGGSTAGVLATLLALVVLAVPGSRGEGERRRRGRDLALISVVALGANAAWWWPFLTASSRAADPAGVPAFAAAADTPFGVLGSLLLGGGLWNDQMWFLERTRWPLAVLALAAVTAVLLAALGRRAWWADPTRRGVSVAGVLGLLLAALAVLPGGSDVLRVVVDGMPGGGLLRDGQKFAALWVLLLALATIDGADRLADRLVGRQTSSAGGLARPALVALLAWPIATLPSLALGHLGRWESVDYAPAMLRVAEQLEDWSAADDGGAVAVLPWSTYRRYAWDGDRVLLDPWPRLLTGPVLADDRLPLRHGVVAGEDPRGAEVGAAIEGGGDVVAALRSAGARYVLVDSSQPDPEHSARGLGPPVLRDGDLVVHDLGPTAAASTTEVPPGRAAGLVLTTLTLLGAIGAVLRSRHARRRPDASSSRSRAVTLAADHDPPEASQ